eukprot:PhM_4_TR7459/c0_g1_i1/m.54268
MAHFENIPEGGGASPSGGFLSLSIDDTALHGAFRGIVSRVDDVKREMGTLTTELRAAKREIKALQKQMEGFATHDDLKSTQRDLDHKIVDLVVAKDVEFQSVVDRVNDNEQRIGEFKRQLSKAELIEREKEKAAQSRRTSRVLGGEGPVEEDLTNLFKALGWCDDQGGVPELPALLHRCPSKEWCALFPPLNRLYKEIDDRFAVFGKRLEKTEVAVETKVDVDIAEGIHRDLREVDAFVSRTAAALREQMDAAIQRVTDVAEQAHTATFIDRFAEGKNGSPLPSPVRSPRGVVDRDARIDALEQSLELLNEEMYRLGRVFDQSQQISLQGVGLSHKARALHRAQQFDDFEHVRSPRSPRTPQQKSPRFNETAEDNSGGMVSSRHSHKIVVKRGSLVADRRESLEASTTTTNATNSNNNNNNSNQSTDKRVSVARIAPDPLTYFHTYIASGSNYNNNSNNISGSPASLSVPKRMNPIGTVGTSGSAGVSTTTGVAAAPTTMVSSSPSPSPSSLKKSVITTSKAQNANKYTVRPKSAPLIHITPSPAPS